MSSPKNPARAVSSRFSLWRRIQPTKSATSTFLHIQVGKRPNGVANSGSLNSDSGSAARAIISGTLRPRDCPRHMAARRPGAVFPTLFADQRHELDRAQVFL